MVRIDTKPIQANPHGPLVKAADKSQRPFLSAGGFALRLPVHPVSCASNRGARKRLRCGDWLGDEVSASDHIQTPLQFRYFTKASSGLESDAAVTRARHLVVL